MKTNKRALRRHHRRRMIRRAYRSYKLSWINDEERLTWRVLRHYNTMQACSCYMCGNPRKHYNELTIQERRFNQAARYEFRYESEA